MTDQKKTCGIDDCPFVCGNYGAIRTIFDTREAARKHLYLHISESIPAKISYHDIDLLPRRADFINKQCAALVDETIAKGQQVLFLPNDITERIDFMKNYSIHMSGIVLSGARAHVILRGVPIYVDVLLGPNDKFASAVKTIINDSNIKNTEKHQLSTNRQFEPHPYNALRVYFDDLSQREVFINNVKRYNMDITDKMTANPPIVKNKPLRAHELEIAIRFETIEMSSDASALSRGAPNGDYFKMICRTYLFRANDWNSILKYKMIKGPGITAGNAPDDYPGSEYVFEVQIDQFRKFSKTNRAAFVERLKKCGLDHHITDPKLIVQTWDIETYSWANTGEPPRREDVKTWSMINMAGTFSYYYTDKILMNYAIIDSGDIKLRVCEKNPFVIECSEEKQVIEAYCELEHRMRPDTMAHFNGGSFDWPCLLGKLEQYGLVETFANAYSACSNKIIYRRKQSARVDKKYVDRSYFAQERMKVTADSNFIIEYTPALFGCIDTDCRALMMQHYSRAENTGRNSLNYFLSEAKLSGKIDMPYMLMFRIYECYKLSKHTTEDIDKLLAEIARKPDWQIFGDALPKTDEEKQEFLRNAVSEINYYCRIDAYRVQQLYVKMAIIQDRREMANLTYVPIRNAVFSSNGNRIINTVGKYAAKNKVAFTENIDKPKDEDKKCSEGGRVWPPVRGFEDKYPVAGLDFSSLYPSGIRDRNLSKNKIIYTKERAEELRALGYIVNALPAYDYKYHSPDCSCHPEVFPVQLYTCAHNGIIDRKQEKIIEKYKKITTYTIKNRGEIKKHVSEVILDSSAEYVDNFEDNKTAAAVSPIYNALFPPQEIAAEIQEAQKTGGSVSTSAEYVPIYGRKALPNEGMGIYGIIMDKLFNKRVPIKKAAGTIATLIEAAKAEGRDTVIYQDKVYTMSEIRFELAKLNAKQNAIKVLTNSFYGQANNFRCSMYELGVGPATTASGRYYITLINKLLSSLDCKIYYGDTDSQYTTIPMKYLYEINQRYNAGIEKIRASGLSEQDTEAELFKLKLQIWNERVNVSFREINKIRDVVNDYLICITGARFMSMAYEEVAYPFAMLGKKKYIFVEHINKINFYPEEVKLKGVDIIKQGKTDILREIGTRVIKTRCLPENKKSFMELCLAELDHYYTKKWELRQFLLKNKYKMDKQNIRVQNFVARMKIEYENAKKSGNHKLAEVCEPPEHGTSFAFYYVVVPQQYDEHGRKIKISKADQMMLATHYDYLCSIGMEPKIDYSHYITDVISLFARLISDLPEFQPPDVSIYKFENNDSYTAYDKYCVDAATDYLEDYCSRYQTVGDGSEGKLAKAIYRAADKQMKSMTRFNIDTGGDVRGELKKIIEVEFPAIRTRAIEQSKYIYDQLIISTRAVRARNKNQQVKTENILSMFNIDVYDAYCLLSNSNKYFVSSRAYVDENIRMCENKMIGLLRSFAEVKTKLSEHKSKIIAELRDKSEGRGLDMSASKSTIESAIAAAITRDGMQHLYDTYEKINDELDAARLELIAWVQSRENTNMHIQTITNMRNTMLKRIAGPDKTAAQLAREDSSIDFKNIEIIDDDKIPPMVAKIQSGDTNISF